MNRKKYKNINYFNIITVLIFFTLYKYHNYDFFGLTRNTFNVLFRVHNRTDKVIVARVSDQRIVNLSREEDTNKYILLWTNSKHFPFCYFGRENEVFIKKKCKWTNCYVTNDRSYLGKYTEFHVIAFNGPQLSMHIFNEDLPNERSIRQKYVYSNIESAGNYPVYDQRFNDYFNWTWTYKLHSDAVWGYMVIKDTNGNIVGPKQEMHWKNIDEMKPIGDDIKAKLQKKTKIAVWFSSNCNTQSLREEYARKLQYYLKSYNLMLDIYGSCGTSQCPKNIMSRCLKLVQKHYYFYMAFENSLSEDYVTEKIVYALNYYTVPVVYGGANYTRFMPDGIYLDATKLTPSELAKSMYVISQNKTKYYNFFKWKNYYSYHFRHEFPETDDYCQFCKMINNETLMNNHSAYKDFAGWWMGDTNERIKNKVQYY